LTKKRLKSLCRLYDYIYTDKPYKNTKTVSFILYRNRIVAFGVNSDKTSPMQNLYREKTPLKDIKNFIDKEHSEINCLRKIDYFDRFDKSEIVVISKKQDGTFRLARPCPICMSAIKDFGIHKIWYTNRENGFSFEKI